jgi:hypothetical protein
MSQYMLALYEAEADTDERAKRDAEKSIWAELDEKLREAGMLVANGRLYPPSVATTVRVRDGETEVTDGPFATTKEILVGYYVLDCADLDQALKHAASLPLARYGSVEVRPLMPPCANPGPGRGAR